MIVSQAEAVHTERVDEGRWESEGGQPVHKLTSEPSPDAALSDLAKPDQAAKTDSLSTASTTATTAVTDATTNSATNSEYDAGKVHPTSIEGKAGDAAESRYPEASTTAASDSTATSSTSTASTLTAPDSEPTVPARKKSISERLAETWQDIKHKVDELTHKK